MPPHLANQPDTLDDAERSEIVVEIGNTQNFLKIDREQLIRLVRRVLLDEGVRSAAVSLVFVDDQTIRQINRDHLHHDWPTDVISFPLSQPGEFELAGELVVSGEMAKATAQSLGATPADELALYVVHGLLHLCGYNDDSDEEIRRMRQRESQALKRVGHANPFPLGSVIPPPELGQE
jgi:probable rRNA maturation factor